MLNGKNITIGSSQVHYYLDNELQDLALISEPKKTVLIIDENLYHLYSKKWEGWKVIVIHPGENSKCFETIQKITEQLINLGVSRDYCLVGVGGGVVTDITGFIGSVFLRGLRFGFIPTSILAMVDASIGGKNGINFGLYKNMLGVIRQPDFLIYDYSFLKTLPESEWKNGFAEIIKHACIKDESMFSTLMEKNLQFYQNELNEMKALIQRNVLLKTEFVQLDESEKSERKKLNFGHTLGHAIENLCGCMHGEAISVGMQFACELSEQILGFPSRQSVENLITKYGLPLTLSYDTKFAFQIMMKDKKQKDGAIDFILLEKIGKAKINSISLDKINNILLLN